MPESTRILDALHAVGEIATEHEGVIGSASIHLAGRGISVDAQRAELARLTELLGPPEESHRADGSGVASWPLCPPLAYPNLHVFTHGDALSTPRPRAVGPYSTSDFLGSAAWHRQQDAMADRAGGEAA